MPARTLNYRNDYGQDFQNLLNVDKFPYSKRIAYADPMKFFKDTYSASIPVESPSFDRASAGGQFRALFLSDLHLGKPLCRADALLAFLKCHKADIIYLVGDVIDFWHLDRRPADWSAAHRAVMSQLVSQAQAGARIHYLPGNHDGILRPYKNFNYSGILVSDRVVHTCLDGRRFLVTHGDQYDLFPRLTRWLGPMGDRFHDVALRLSNYVNSVQKAGNYVNGLSFSSFTKRLMKAAILHLGQFDAKVSEELHADGLDGIVCGHFHHAERREIRGLDYFNSGDWMESCTAVAECYDSSVGILRWRAGKSV